MFFLGFAISVVRGAGLILGAQPGSFPLPALLHAICAVASFYVTKDIECPPPPSIDDPAGDELYASGNGIVANTGQTPRTRNQVFGDQHALWSNLQAYKATEKGENMLQVLQCE